MKYLKKFNENKDVSDWLEKRFGKKERLEDQFLDKVLVGMNSDLDEIRKLWIHILVFKCSIVDHLLGFENRRDNIIREFEYRIVDGEDPKEVCTDIYNKLPNKPNVIEKAYKRIFNIEDETH